MSDPKFDRDDPDAGSMFDFLAEEGAGKHRRKPRGAEASERALPIIRKPVPVSESGPLLPPRPGARVEPPPSLTDGSTSVDDDLDFLNDMPTTFPGSQASRERAVKPDPDSNITRLAPRDQRPRRESDRVSGAGPRRSPDVPKSGSGDLELDLSDAPVFRRQQKNASVVAEDYYYEDEFSPRRGRWLLLALLLLAAGAGSFLFANPGDWPAQVQKLKRYFDTATLTGNSVPADPVRAPSTVNDEVALTVSPLMQQFRQQLSRVEGLIADGALDDADRVLSSMDRTVYGYGAAEFGDLESQIEQLRTGAVVADPATAQAERDAADQAAQAETERLAAAEQATRDAEIARAAEQSRIAAAAEQAQAAQEASVRQAAAEQSAREEQARVTAASASQAAELQAAAERQEQARQEQARQEQARQEQARQEQARQEQARQEEKARLAAQTARTSDWQSVQADRQATDRRIAAERAALQRQQARDQRLIEAREREAALAAQAASQTSRDVPAADVPADTAKRSQEATAQTPITTASNEVVASGPKPIGDDELQSVYRRFIDLQQAVSSRDITAVVGLTQRSGARVQQLMQVFENSTQIDARIRNVSTSNATGQIKGTLQINRIKRSDGTFVEPPSALSSISLSSQREGDGWSAISW